MLFVHRCGQILGAVTSLIRYGRFWTICFSNRITTAHPRCTTLDLLSFQANCRKGLMCAGPYCSDPEVVPDAIIVHARPCAQRLNSLLVLQSCIETEVLWSMSVSPDGGRVLEAEGCRADGYIAMQTATSRCVHLVSGSVHRSAPTGFPLSSVTAAARARAPPRVKKLKKSWFSSGRFVT